MFLRAFSILTICWLIALPVSADDIQTLLFEEANIALKEADARDAKILSPKNYAKGFKLYKDAKARLKKGHSIEKIKKSLAGATQNLNAAIASSEIASRSFHAMIKARGDALRAEAQKYAATEWQSAEASFIAATSKLETRSLKKAQKIADKAESLFRAAELTAIKANYLTETRELLVQAKKEKTHKFAPNTYAKAQLLLAKAEKTLTDNRYDIDEPRAIAREAKYEAGHAIQIAQQVKKLNAKTITKEELILALEDPVVKIGSALDLTPEFDGSISDPTYSIHQRIGELLNDSAELTEKTNDVIALEKILAELEEKLGVQSKRLEQQELHRKRISRIESLFAAEEAMVLKKGDSIILRMVGLNFKPNSASLNSENFSLLKKVQDAIKVFPNARVIIEGHTDSFGSDTTNLDLSKQRAESVRSYLIANGTTGSVEAIGYGETKPIGNNETAEGRKKNRRIDLVIGQ